MERKNSIGLTAAFATVTTLFFAWGFITSNNDPLIAALKAIFSLSYTEAMLTQFLFFLAYGVMSLPAAALMNRVGAVRSILIALATMLAACLLVQGVTQMQTYSLILAALFIMAAGITVLQVAANPLAAALGPQETSHFRLTLAQAFNSLGVVLGVHFGSRIMLGEGLHNAEGHLADPSQKIAALGAVTHAFLLIGGLIVLLFLFIAFSRKRLETASGALGTGEHGSVLDALKSRWALMGALAIFLYVGAEVAIGSLMINFLNQRAIMGLPLEAAGTYLANFYWGGALVGRFIGSWLLTKLPAPRLLALCAAINIALCLTVALSAGPMAGYAALAVGLFNSIMFPTIFTITLERAGVSEASTSGLLCLAIVGGAVLPLAAGKLADMISPSTAFYVPMLAYAGILLFTLAAAKARVFTTDTQASATIAH